MGFVKAQERETEAHQTHQKPFQMVQGSPSWLFSGKFTPLFYRTSSPSGPLPKKKGKKKKKEAKTVATALCSHMILSHVSFSDWVAETGLQRGPERKLGGPERQL